MNNPKFNSKLTQNVLNEIHNKLETLKDYEFSVFNIFELFAEMRKSITVGIEATIMKLFNKMSAKHHYFDETSKNIHYYNGWKTNKSWKVNKKVILPFYCRSGYYDSRIDVFRACAEVGDLVRTLDYLDNGMTESVHNTPEKDVEINLNNGNSKNISVRHIEVTFYKKGTMHIKFTNEKLLEKFNLYCGMGKNFLPPSFGRKHYNDMSSEEQAIAIEFSGDVVNYEKIVSEQNYYLENKNIKMLTE